MEALFAVVSFALIAVGSLCIFITFENDRRRRLYFDNKQSAKQEAFSASAVLSERKDTIAL
ncbi:hypothetical protein [Paenibacillus hamazuiensis]|uniref:hypothetical protein n=1 Tax=Paenibacillus hamazuiensis TaxID=2936508 RepID=UPI00200D44D8|nr:hypothetical protein [Paenibacillus hamazuiensis]